VFTPRRPKPVSRLTHRRLAARYDVCGTPDGSRWIRRKDASGHQIVEESTDGGKVLLDGGPLKPQGPSCSIYAATVTGSISSSPSRRSSLQSKNCFTARA
jgi:hypothetical protein